MLNAMRVRMEMVASLTKNPASAGSLVERTWQVT